MKAADEVIEVNREELQALLERKRETLGEEDYQKLQKLLRAFSYLAALIGEKDTTISQLRALLMKPSTEKTSRVLEQAGLEAARKNPPSRLTTNQKPKPGHGRNGAEAYCGAVRIPIAHRSLNPGDRCPECLKGKVYEQKKPGLRIRVVGHAPIAATVYELERLRCNLCGEVFEAEAPEGVGEKKYDESAAAMIALLKYGSGVPFYRLAGLEKNLGIRLPASTQWEIVEELAEGIRSVFEELIRQAAQGEVFHNDDTKMKILSLDRESAPALGSPEESSRSSERTGLFTSGIVSTKQGQRSRCFSPGGGTRERTSPRCWRTVPRDCLRRFKWPMACRGTLPSCRRRCRSSSETVTRTRGGALWRWCPISRRNAITCWKAWLRCTGMRPRPKSEACPRRSDCVFIRNTADQ